MEFEFYTGEEEIGEEYGEGKENEDENEKEKEKENKMEIKKGGEYEIHVENALIFRVMTSAVLKIIGDCCWRFSEEGISCNVMGTEGLAMVSLFVKKEFFPYFSWPGEEDLLGIDSKLFLSLLKFAENDFVFLKKKKKNKNKKKSEESESEESEASELELLSVTFENPAKTCIRSFQFPFLDLSTNQVEVPELEVNFVVTVRWDVFLKVCKEAAALGDQTKMSISSSELKIESTNESVSCSQILYARKQDEQEDVTNTAQIVVKNPDIKTCSQIFSSEVLKKFTEPENLARISPFVVLYFGDQIPLRFQWENKSQSINVNFYIAPKSAEPEAAAPPMPELVREPDESEPELELSELSELSATRKKKKRKQNQKHPKEKTEAPSKKKWLKAPQKTKQQQEEFKSKNKSKSKNKNKNKNRIKLNEKEQETEIIQID